jgi:arsenical pump membrane protein
MNSTGTVQFNPANPHAWISIIVFLICILFVILAPNLPIPLPAKSFLITLWYRIRRKPQPEESITLTTESKIEFVEEKPVESTPSLPVVEIELQSGENIVPVESQTNSDVSHDDTPVISMSTNTDDHQHDVLSDSLLSDHPIVVDPPKKNYFLYPFPIDLGSAPIIALLFMFATTTLSWANFVKGIIGDDFIQPYSIIILFMSLAYVCISLDRTGIFQFLAYWIIDKSKGKGHRMWFGLCAFASILTVFTSNDVVILTLTPICCYMGTQGNMNPMPFMFGQFFLANIWSISLEIGNPTNIIVAEAYKLGFMRYMAWMVIPAIVAGVSCWILLYIVFYKQIPLEVTQTTDSQDATKMIKSKAWAIVKTILLLSCLLFLAISSTITSENYPVRLWMICAAYGLLFFTLDVGNDIWGLIKEKEKHFEVTLPALQRLPWKIPPFVVGMFVSVELLKFYGWISLFAGWLAWFLNTIAPTSDDGGFGTVWGIMVSSITVAFLSAIFCNVLNNQPMTILFTNLLNDQAFNVTPIMKLSSTLALIIGSNLGANITLIGALAGIMWNNILSQNGLKVGYFKFLMYGLMITPIVILLCSLSLGVEAVFYNFVIAGGAMGNGTMANSNQSMISF